MFGIAPAGMLVVDGLYAPSAGNIVFVGGEFQLPVIRNFKTHLCQALSIGPGTKNHSPVKVLQSATGNLARAGSIAVHQYHDGHHRVDRFYRSLEIMVHTFRLSAVGSNGNAGPYEHVHNTYRLLFRAPSVATQVKHKTLYTFLLHLQIGTTHLLGTPFCKLRQIDVAHTLRANAVVGNSRHLNGTSCNLQFQYLACRRATHAELKGRAYIASQTLTHIGIVFANHRLPVNTQNHITLAQTHFCRRHSFIRLLDDSVTQLHIPTDNRTDTGIFAGIDGFQFVDFLLRIVFSIGVKAAEHGPDTITYYFLGIKRVNIHHV